MGKRSILIILGLLIVAVLVLVLHLPVGDWLERALDWVRQLGPWGPLVLTVLYVVTGVLLLPGSPLTVGVGFLYGVPLGFLIVWIGNTLGACAAFLVGRTMARGWVARRVAGSATFRAIDHAVARHGFKIVLLTRLSHIIPFNLLNYVFGITRISLPRYALASWLGLISGILMYVYIGAGLRPIAAAAADIEESVPAPLIHQIFWLGLAATVLLVAVAAAIAHQVLRRDLAEVPDEPLQDGE